MTVNLHAHSVMATGMATSAIAMSRFVKYLLAIWLAASVTIDLTLSLPDVCFEGEYLDTVVDYVYSCTDVCIPNTSMFEADCRTNCKGM